MINRQSIKERAKIAFTNFYWPHVGIFAILVMIAGGASGLSSFSGSVSNLNNTGAGNLDIPPQIAAVIAVIAIFAGLIGIAYAIFVAGPVQISGARIGLKAYRGEKPDFRNLIYCVREGRYWKCVGTMALVTLFLGLAITVPMVIVGAIAAVVFAVTLAGTEATAGVIAGGIALMILAMFAAMIPGLIVSYGLSQTQYVAADEGVYGMEALRRSWDMMRGHKWERFVFGLSFIGWVMLIPLSFGVVGIFYAGPYMNISYAGYYHELTGGDREPVAEDAVILQ